MIAQQRNTRRRRQWDRLAFPPLALAFVLALCPLVLANSPTRIRRLEYDPAARSWTEAPPPPPGTAPGDLHILRVHVAVRRFRSAITATANFAKRYGVSDPLYPETLVIRAEALIGLKRYDQAYKTLETFFSQYEGMIITSEAVRLQFLVAEAYLGGVKRRFLGIPLLSGEERAFEILDEISTDDPDSPTAQLAVKTKADYLFRKGEHALAEQEYARMMREFPGSRYHQFAQRKAADAALASYGGTEFDEAALIEARERFVDYQVRYHDAATREGVELILNSIREGQAEKELAIAQFYERTDHLASAVFYYRIVRDEFPDTVAAQKSSDRLMLLAPPPGATTEPKP